VFHSPSAYGSEIVADVLSFTARMQILFLHSYLFLLPYKNICFTLILEHHKKSGEWKKIEFPKEYYILIWEQQD